LSTLRALIPPIVRFPGASKGGWDSPLDAEEQNMNIEECSTAGGGLPQAETTASASHQCSTAGGGLPPSRHEGRGVGNPANPANPVGPLAPSRPSLGVQRCCLQP
jgi:hypothetical protein